MSWKVVDRYLLPDIVSYISRLGNLHFNSLLDILWTMLETIERFNLHEGGVWSAPFDIVQKLAQTLKKLRNDSNPLYNIKNLTTSMDLASKICPNQLDYGAESVKDYLFAVIQLFSMLTELLPTDDPIIIESVRSIVSKRRDPSGQSLYGAHNLITVACSYSEEHFPAHNQFAVINLLLKNEVDPGVSILIEKIRTGGRPLTSTAYADLK